MNQEKPSSKQMIIDIQEMASFARTASGDRKSYVSLLNLIIKMGEEDPITNRTMKSIASSLEWTSVRVRKELGLMYNDLMEFFNDAKEPLQLSKIETVLHMEAFGNYQRISLNLGFVPREGEEIEIPFFKAKLMTSMFYVTRVQHHFTHQKHTILVWLKSGLRNRYVVWKRDRALTERKISLHDYLEMDDFELEGLIRRGVL